ncbi:hypothetical protein D3C85_1642160 [compost metagenome]
MALVIQGCKLLGFLIILFHSADALVEIIVGAEDVRIQADQIAAVASFPYLGALCEGLISRQDSSGDAANTFVEGDIHTVE